MALHAAANVGIHHIDTTLESLKEGDYLCHAYGLSALSRKEVCQFWAVTLKLDVAGALQAKAKLLSRLSRSCAFLHAELTYLPPAQQPQRAQQTASSVNFQILH